MLYWTHIYFTTLIQLNLGYFKCMQWQCTKPKLYAKFKSGLYNIKLVTLSKYAKYVSAIFSSFFITRLWQYRLTV